MENKRGFDPDAALRDYFLFVRKDDEAAMRAVRRPDSRHVPLEKALNSKVRRFWRRAGSCAALAACLAFVILMPFRSPIIESSGKIFAKSAENGTFDIIFRNAVALARETGRNFSPRRSP
jgi:hypothetical protein